MPDATPKRVRLDAKLGKAPSAQVTAVERGTGNIRATARKAIALKAAARMRNAGKSVSTRTRKEQ
jgi:hypothetical protein